MDTAIALSRRFAADHPSEAAQVLEHLGSEEAVLGLNSLPADLAAGVLARFNTSAAVQCLAQLEEKAAVEIVACLSLETAAMFLRPQTPQRRTALLDGLPPDVAEPLRRSLVYPPGSAGALMNPLVFTLPDDIGVGEALERVRRTPEHAMYYLYLVNRHQSLVGVVNIRELMLAEPEQKLASIARTQVETLSAYAHRDEISAHPGWLALHALPVVDDGGRLVGVLRHKTLRQQTSEGEVQAAQTAARVRHASTALADLYRIGITGLARGTFTALAGRHDSAKEPEA